MPQSNDKPSLLSAGGGIARWEEDDAPVTPAAEKPPVSVEVVTDEAGDPVWSDVPTFARQWLEHPDTCRPGKLQVAVFDLVDKGELEAYNSLIAQAFPPEAPRIEVLNDMVHPPTADGKMLALVRYRRMQYKRIIRERI